MLLLRFFSTSLLAYILKTLGGGGGTDVLVYTYILYHLVFVDNSVSELDIRYIYMTLFGEFLHCLGFPVHLPLYEGRYSAPGRMMSPHYTSILV